MISAALLPASLVLLAVTAPSPVGAAVFAALFGLGNGLYSIVGSTLPLVLFGPEGVRRVAGARHVHSADRRLGGVVRLRPCGGPDGRRLTALLGCAAVVAFAAVGFLVAKPTVR